MRNTRLSLSQAAKCLTSFTHKPGKAAHPPAVLVQIAGVEPHLVGCLGCVLERRSSLQRHHTTGALLLGILGGLVIRHDRCFREPGASSKKTGDAQAGAGGRVGAIRLSAGTGGDRLRIADRLASELVRIVQQISLKFWLNAAPGWVLL
jgi:hypothetical protein